MKKFVCIITGAIILGIFSCSEAENVTDNVIGEQVQYDIKLDGENIKFIKPAINVDGVTYVPMKEFAMEAGFEVEWNPNDNTAEIYTSPREYESDNWTVFSEYNEKNRCNMYGYADENGNVMLKPRFYDAQEFSEGRAAVRMDAKDPDYFIIDETGELVTDQPFAYVSIYSEGLSVVSDPPFEAQYDEYFIDKWGNRAFGGKEYLGAGNFSEGVAVVRTQGERWQRKYPKIIKYSYLNIYGDRATDKEWDRVWPFENGYAKVKDNGQMMRIDKNFEVVEYLDEDGNPLTK